MKNKCFLFLLGLFIAPTVFGQTIGNYISVQPLSSRPSTFVYPTATHSFQVLRKTGQSLTLGGNLGSTLDFTGYIPIGGSSTHGYLSVASETTTAECAIFEIQYNSSTGLWEIITSGKADLTSSGVTNEIATCRRFCSGGVTPWGTVIHSEETTDAADANSDGYQDFGWHVEFDPVTRKVVNQTGGNANYDKLWAMGRIAHENVCIASDNKTCYYGADAGGTSYVYKYIATTAGNLSSGALYVLRMTGGVTGTTGTWVLIANSSQADRNNTVSLSTAVSATSFDGVEDVEIGPVDGKIYFTSKGTGRIYRFRDLGSTIDQSEIFVSNTSYTITHSSGSASASWGTGNDNLVFDGQGNLWVTNDGAGNELWMVKPGHTTASPQIEMFGEIPSGYEPTGLTFTPDYRFGFLSFQGSGSGGTQMDVGGTSHTWNNSTTLIISRKENLGPGALPVNFLDFSAFPVAEHEVELQWTTTAERNCHYFEVERGSDGKVFTTISERITAMNQYTRINHYSFHDKETKEKSCYYRIRQTDLNGKITYSKVFFFDSGEENGLKIKRIFPNPVIDKFKVEVSTEKERTCQIRITDEAGKLLFAEKRNFSKGDTILSYSSDILSGGINFISISDDITVTYKIVK